jgi:hypothetical protein
MKLRISYLSIILNWSLVTCMISFANGFGKDITDASDPPIVTLRAE